MKRQCDNSNCNMCLVSIEVYILCCDLLRPLTLLVAILRVYIWVQHVVFLDNNVTNLDKSLSLFFKSIISISGPL